MPGSVGEQTEMNKRATGTALTRHPETGTYQMVTYSIRNETNINKAPKHRFSVGAGMW